MLFVHGLGEAPGVVQIGVGGLPPQDIGVFGVGQAARDAVIQPRAFLQAEEALGRAVVAVDEGAIALVHVRGDQLGAFGVGTGHDQGRGAHDVGGQARGDQVALMRLGRDQNLAAEVAAFLLRRQLVLEMDARSAGLDEGLHDLEAVQRPAETGLGVGHDGHEPVPLGAALGVLDLVGALQGAVDAAAQFRCGVGRVQRLVRIHGPGGVGVGRDLPARQIDGLQPGPDHLHGLVSGHGAEGVDIGLVVKQLPQAVGSALGQGVGDRDRAAQTQDVFRRIGPLDTVEAADGRRDEMGEAGGHVGLGSEAADIAAGLEEQNTPKSRMTQH